MAAAVNSSMQMVATNAGPNPNRNDAAMDRTAQHQCVEGHRGVWNLMPASRKARIPMPICRCNPSPTCRTGQTRSLTTGLNDTTMGQAHYQRVEQHEDGANSTPMCRGGVSYPQPVGNPYQKHKDGQEPTLTCRATRLGTTVEPPADVAQDTKADGSPFRHVKQPQRVERYEDATVGLGIGAEPNGSALGI